MKKQLFLLAVVFGLFFAGCTKAQILRSAQVAVTESKIVKDPKTKQEKVVYKKVKKEAPFKGSGFQIGIEGSIVSNASQVGAFDAAIFAGGFGCPFQGVLCIEFHGWTALRPQPSKLLAFGGGIGATWYPLSNRHWLGITPAYAKFEYIDTFVYLQPVFRFTVEHGIRFDWKPFGPFAHASLPFDIRFKWGADIVPGSSGFIPPQTVFFAGISLRFFVNLSFANFFSDGRSATVINTSTRSGYRMNPVRRNTSPDYSEPGSLDAWRARQERARAARRDFDGDGTIDGVDACPRQKGPKANRGCPWPDSDRDGITDNLDKCPAKKGPKANNGCPWGDTDGDGIRDDIDKCPKRRGPMKHGGCPPPSVR